jgi:hypothetical protein
MSCGGYTGAYTDPVTNATATEIICRGSNPQYVGNNWYEYWSGLNGNICLNEFASILYGAETTSGVRAYDPTQLQRVQDDMNNAFATYNQLHPITDASNPAFNPFQVTLLNTCASLPGLCDEFLNNFCTGCTRDQISLDQTLLTACGCRGPLSPYDITAACDPLCNRVSSIKNIDDATGVAQVCNTDVCVIDNININAANTTLGGGIIFSQLCGNCSQNCTCIIASNNINGVLAQAGLTNAVQFDTACNGSSMCYNSNPTTGDLNSIQCPKSASFAFLADPVNVGDNTIWLLIILTLVVVIAIVTVYWYKR